MTSFRRCDTSRTVGLHYHVRNCTDSVTHDIQLVLRKDKTLRRESRWAAAGLTKESVDARNTARIIFSSNV